MTESGFSPLRKEVNFPQFVVARACF